jgi:hypothetical protein
MFKSVSQFRNVSEQRNQCHCNLGRYFGNTICSELQQKSLLKFVAEDKFDTHRLQWALARDWAGQSIHVLINAANKTLYADYHVQLNEACNFPHTLNMKCSNECILLWSYAQILCSTAQTQCFSDCPKCETSENNGLILCVYAQVLCKTYIYIPCTFRPKLVFIVLMQLESSI